MRPFVKALKGLTSDGSNSEMDTGPCLWQGPWEWGKDKAKVRVGLWRKLNKEPGHVHAKPLAGKGFDHHIINLEQSLRWYIFKLHLNVK